MMIGKAGAAVTSISTADAASITVRGRDLTSDLMGRIGFTAYFHLLVTGREPTEDWTNRLADRPMSGWSKRLTPVAAASQSAGLLPWTFFANAIASSGNSLVVKCSAAVMIQSRSTPESPLNTRSNKLLAASVNFVFTAVR